MTFCEYLDHAWQIYHPTNNGLSHIAHVYIERREVSIWNTYTFVCLCGEKVKVRKRWNDK